MEEELTFDKLAKAVEDAERGPTAEALDSAPLLSDWQLVLSGTILLAEGDLEGHPTIKEPWVRTSPVLAFDVAAGWMRTRSRWYKLGPPADVGHLNIIEAEAQRVLALLRQKVLDAASTEAEPTQSD